MLYAFGLAQFFHQLGVLIWIGGMFFAHFALRPAANQHLEPPKRLPLMLGVLQRFFPWVWAAIALLWSSGLWIFLGIAQGKMGLWVHLMMGIALLMTLIFSVIWFLPFRQLRGAVDQQDWSAAGKALARIRQLIATNLTLGLLTVFIASAGPGFFGAFFQSAFQSAFSH